MEVQNINSSEADSTSEYTPEQGSATADSSPTSEEQSVTADSSPTSEEQSVTADSSSTPSADNLDFNDISARVLSNDDAEQFYNLWFDVVNENSNFWLIDQNEMDQCDRTILPDNSINFGVFHHSKLIGFFTFYFYDREPEYHKLDVTYVLHKDYRRKGIMRSFFSSVVLYLRKNLPHVQEIIAYISTLNVSSMSFAENMGFMCEAMLRNFYKKNGVLFDVYIYRLHIGN